ncbi:MAG TPA: DNRLRE domain-containing protein [Polyangiaceae bacterium]|nr:DNRLRE domain-containing protein [Polyangiaceae bacterium]
MKLGGSLFGSSLVGVAALLVSVTAAAETAVVSGQTYGLNQVSWNGSSRGDPTRVGGYMRSPLTAFDFETLTHFDLSAVAGHVNSARLRFQVTGGTITSSQTVQLFEEDILSSWDPATVSYSTFTGDWTNLLGSASVASGQTGVVDISSAALASLVQRWLDDPSSNNGAVLTGSFWYWGYYVDIGSVTLEVDYDPAVSWETVGSDPIASILVGGPHDAAMGPDGTPYVALRHEIPCMRAHCMPSWTSEVYRYGASGWENLAPGTSLGGSFVAVEVTADNDVVAVTGDNGAYRFNGVSWDVLPAVPLSDAVAFGFPVPELATGPSSELVVAARHASSTGMVALRFDGTSWELLGGAPFWDNIAPTSLAVAPDGTPHVAFVDYAANAIAILAFDGASWVGAGTADLGSLASASFPDLAFSPSGQAYVAIAGSEGGDSVVRVFAEDGASWTELAGDLVATGGLFNTNPSLAVAADGTPLVTYVKNIGSASSPIEAHSVARFAGDAWVDDTFGGYSGHTVNDDILLVALDLTPFVAFNAGSGVAVKARY